VNDKAKQPNSFVYRFIPRNPHNLDAGGTLQALQVTSNRTGEPIVFHDGQADQDITSPDVRDLHTYGMDFRTRWVTLHDTSTDGFGAFDANALAKQVQATPFKRPENGVFAPATGFSRFVFTETGDTDADSQAGAALGGFGALFELRENGPRANRGHLRMVIRGDELHTGFDNIAFADRTTVLVAEDAGDTLHTQRGRFDSLYAIRTDVSYANGGHHPVRVMYVGRDASATIDSALGDFNGFQNEGDNEATGIHVSDGNPTVAGLLGVKVPHAFAPGSPWRVFVTAQHGDNVTYELTRSS
jgi:secreted PhoX family phosphatase